MDQSILDLGSQTKSQEKEHSLGSMEKLTLEAGKTALKLAKECKLGPMVEGMKENIHQTKCMGRVGISGQMEGSMWGHGSKERCMD